MPGIDFDRLRREITMEEVLHLLGFQPCQTNRRPMVRRVSLARFHGRPSPPLLRERGQPSLLLPQVSQPRQPVGTVGRLHPKATASRDDRSLPRLGTRNPLDSTLVTSSWTVLTP